MFSCFGQNEEVSKIQRFYFESCRGCAPEFSFTYDLLDHSVNVKRVLIKKNNISINKIGGKVEYMFEVEYIPPGGFIVILVRNGLHENIRTIRKDL